MKWNESFYTVASVFSLVLLSSPSFGEINSDNAEINQRDRSSAEMTGTV